MARSLICRMRPSTSIQSPRTFAAAAEKVGCKGQREKSRRAREFQRFGSQRQEFPLAFRVSKLGSFRWSPEWKIEHPTGAPLYLLYGDGLYGQKYGTVVRGGVITQPRLTSCHSIWRCARPDWFSRNRKLLCKAVWRRDKGEEILLNALCGFVRRSFPTVG